MVDKSDLEGDLATDPKPQQPSSVTKVKPVPLMEMFGPTIQGEGAEIGRQTFFLRFGLCDYKCKMCDSMHAVDPRSVKANATWLSPEQIAWDLCEMRDKKWPCTHWVTFSGGNPCIHDLTSLVTPLKLSSPAWMINVETQGTFCPAWLRGVDKITVSPKGPGMGEKCDYKTLDAFIRQVNSWGHIGKLSLKIVVFDQRDLEFAADLIDKYGVLIGWSNIYLSLGNPYPPSSPTTDLNVGARLPDDQLRDLLIRQYKILFEDIQNNRFLCKVKFLPQWHVVVWGNERSR